MKKHVGFWMLCVIFLSTLFLGFGYASFSTVLPIYGTEDLSPPDRPYISSIEPGYSGGVSVTGKSGTLMMTQVLSQGTATFRVTVVNPTRDTYVYERVIDGAETGVEGVYTGTAITYMVEGISSMDELPSGESVTFTVRIAVPRGVTADQYALLFNFILKGSAEILPDGTKYEVHFKLNNGEEDQMLFVEKGKRIPQPADPVREGYLFTGWYKDPTLLSMWDFAVETVNANIILYAGWRSEAEPEPPIIPEPEVIQYEVVFEYYNGDPNLVILVDEGALIPKPADPSREGYTFTGWYKDVDGINKWNFETDTVNMSIMLHAGWKDPNSGDDSELMSDFAGLVAALLDPKTNNGLNNSSMIYNAIRESLTSSKRPDEDAPILHCAVNSVSGGTMTDVAMSANAKLTKNLHFIFEADPNNNNRLLLYMYYGEDCTEDVVGTEIMVYKQVVTRGSDGVWIKDGTYIGRATVGYYYGGGKNGKDALTVDAYSWKAGIATIEETN